ncbi:hypothetical protein L3N51_02104 [Metallosphaera sp. J1]|uniref:FAD-binding oxidoreductase n=1 Tax=Metallosphaera javensis (ex Hofmann et al. 2022) TaxID=99938 RepID=UPI001EE031E7|nr:FAD-binding oxidoreductase [Metallosphaera javensis (ex Hofmann et al. 2022)]MCG3109808.1 hypothetical protein [Metallosphaera javensis (ex Hofmann et al. 2022)]
MWVDDLEKIAPLRIGEDSRVVIVEPGTEEEFRDVVNLVRERGLKAHVMGTGRNHVGERVSADVYISTHRYTGVLESSIGDLYATVRSGTPFSELLEVLRREGLWIPFFHQGSVGGFASLNIPFHFSLFHGYPRDWLLGAKVLTGLGEVIRTGSRTPKFSSGYKVWKAMSGALGRLGLYLDVIIRAIPLPEEIFPAEIKLAQINDAILRGAVGVTIYRSESERVIAWFMGHSGYVRKVTSDYRSADVPECSGERIYSVVSTRGLERESVSDVRAECVISFYGSGYSRLYNPEDVDKIRAVGLKIIGEKGCQAECLPQPPQSFLVLKSALDPQGVFI